MMVYMKGINYWYTNINDENKKYIQCLAAHLQALFFGLYNLSRRFLLEYLCTFDFPSFSLLLIALIIFFFSSDFNRSIFYLLKFLENLDTNLSFTMSYSIGSIP